MGTKRMAGIVVLILGIAMIIYAVHSMNRIAEAKGTANAITSPFSGNPVGKIVHEAAEQETSKYDTTVMVLLISGIVLTVAGCGIALLCPKK